MSRLAKINDADDAQKTQIQNYMATLVRFLEPVWTDVQAALGSERSYTESAVKFSLQLET